MYTTTSITTPQRVIAYILLCSQMLTNCFNFDTPGKEEISDRKAKLHYSPTEEVESGTLPTNFLFTTQLHQVIPCQKIDGAWQAELAQEGQILPMLCKIAYRLANVYNAGVSEQQELVQLVKTPNKGKEKTYIYRRRGPLHQQPISNHQMLLEENNKAGLQRILDSLSVSVQFLSKEEESEQTEQKASVAIEGIGKEEVKVQEDKNLKQEKNYDFPGGEKIPQSIQLDNDKTIKIEFGYSEDGISADHAVNSTLIAAFKDSLNMVSQSCDFHTVYISTTTNGHDESEVSNHKIDNGALAIDISRIDGKPIEALGANHPWVIAFQHAMDELPNIKENFGPCWLHKEGVAYSPKPACRKQELCEQHKNHIHFSIKK